MGYLVHGRLNSATITVTAKDARDAAKQASELARRGAHDIRFKDEDQGAPPLEDPERSLKAGTPT